MVAMCTGGLRPWNRFVRLNGWRMLTTSEMIGKVTLAVASGKIGVGELTIRFRQHMRKEE